VTGHVVVLNGELYNFADLRRRLVAEGQEFQSTGDTAVMLRVLGLHGPGAVSWLRGMFAFACWDPKQRRLLLARDPLGIKPLYLARSSDPDAGWSVAFASELRALLASGLCWARLTLTRRPRGQQRMERLRGRPLVPPSKTSTCSGRAVCSSSTAPARRSTRLTSGASPTAPQIRPWTRTASPPSWRRG
jgi:asparagine synthetase B (glutamine-hydrolysing)